MHWGPRLLLGAALGVALCGCGDDEPGPSSKPEPTELNCSEGFAPDEDLCRPVHAAECPAGTMAQLGQAECVSVGWLECPTGFEADPTGWGCRAVLPADACPPGTMARVGSSTCEPVGWKDCPNGFDSDPSGWGCREVLPDTACSGATRAALGSATCVPVGDCGAAFPPANATLFVDESFTAGELDATHFLTVGEAVAAAVDGDVIAVEAGTYVDAIQASVDLSVVGRCPELTVIESDGGARGGVEALSGEQVSIRALTLRGHGPGLIAFNGSEIVAEHVVVEQSRDAGVVSIDTGTIVELTESVVRNTAVVTGQQGQGIYAETNGRVVLTDSEIADNVTAGVLVLDGQFEAEGAVIHRTVQVGTAFGHGVHVQGGSASVQRSVIADNHTLGVYSSGSGSLASLDQVVLRDTQPSANGQFGIGLQVDSGGSAEVRRSLLAANHFIGVFGFDPVQITIESSIIRDTIPRNDSDNGRGISIQEGASLTLDDSVLIDNSDYGASAGGPGTALTVSNSLVRDTKRASSGTHGWGLNIADGATLQMERSTLRDNLEYGLAVGRGSTATVSDSLVSGTERAEGVTVDDVDFRVQGIGIQDGGAMTIDRSVIRGNRHIGLYVWDAIASPTPTTVTATHLVVDDTLPEMDTGSGNGSGVVVGLNAQATFNQVALVNNTTVGLLATEPGAVAAIADSVIRNTQINNDGLFGRGANAQSGGRIDLTRSALIENSEIAVFSSAAGHVVMNDTLVDRTQPDSLATAGRGLEISYGGLLEAYGSTILGSQEVGAFVTGAGATLTMQGSLIGLTSLRADQLHGHNVIVQDSSHVNLDRTRIFEGASAGIVFAGASGILSSNFVDQNRVGIHLQDGSVLEEVSDLPAAQPNTVYVTDDTRFIDNEIRVGNGAVPIPTPGGIAD